MSPRDPPSFSASAVAFSHDDDVEAVVLVLAEQSDGRGRTLEVQRAYEDDDYDVAQGLTGHCVVLDAGPTAYGCIEARTVEPGEVSLCFTSEGAKELSVEGIAVSIAGGSDLISAALTELIDDGPPADDFALS